MEDKNVLSESEETAVTGGNIVSAAAPHTPVRTAGAKW